MTTEEPSPWAKITGPCYTVTSMARALGWSAAEVVEAGTSLRLLMLRTDDYALLFPSFQLHDGRIVEGLSDVLRILRTGTASAWTWAQWLNTPVPDDDPPRSIDRLRQGRRDNVLRAAEQDARAWSS